VETATGRLDGVTTEVTPMDALYARSLTRSELARELMYHSDPAVSILARIVLDMEAEAAESRKRINSLHYTATSLREDLNDALRRELTARTIR
jgi:hypothetical protein